jgi:hypothetical protein
VVTGLVFLGSIGSIVEHRSNSAALHAADGGPTVTIGSPLPVPVTGSVSIAGASSVNVNNTAQNPVPVAVAGTPGVNISNTPNVQIVNSPQNPVLAQMTSPPLQVFDEGFATGPNQPPISVLVPPGKIWVIEYVSFDCGDVLGVKPFTGSFRTANGGKFAYYFFPALPVSPTEAAVSQQTRIYAVGPSAVTVYPGLAAQCLTSMSGHLESAP